MVWACRKKGVVLIEKRADRIANGKHLKSEERKYSRENTHEMDGI
jgi:hypothetical protein